MQLRVKRSTFSNFQEGMSIKKNAAVLTDPECLGPCDPGSSVVLEGIVWNESRNGEYFIAPSAIFANEILRFENCSPSSWCALFVRRIDLFQITTLHSRSLLDLCQNFHSEVYQSLSLKTYANAFVFKRQRVDLTFRLRWKSNKNS